jgi:hypothetical protein
METDGILCEGCGKLVCESCRCDRDEYYLQNMCEACANAEDAAFRAERLKEKRRKARVAKRRMLRRLSLTVPA